MRRRFFNNNIEDFDINDYLTIEALEDNLQVNFPYEDLMYGIDGLGWQKLKAGAYSPAINKGQTISFKGNVRSTITNRKSFTITKRCNLLGNCTSLTLDDIPRFICLFLNCQTIVSVSKDFLPATALVASCYENMFSGCTSLVTAPELPAMTLADGCYRSMFAGCSSLVNAPALPATTLAQYCYSSMFSRCASLVNAALPATTLVSNCYEYMFQNCTKLNYIKMLATDISATSCLCNWVSGVASTGTFVKNPEATWDRVGVDGVPSGWTVKFDGEEDKKTVNKGTITIGAKKYTITFDYPVTSDVRVVFDSATVTIYTGSISGSLSVGPGEEPVFKGLSPYEDDTYIYEIVQ